MSTYAGFGLPWIWERGGSVGSNTELSCGQQVHEGPQHRTGCTSVGNSGAHLDLEGRKMFKTKGKQAVANQVCYVEVPSTITPHCLCSKL